MGKGQGLQTLRDKKVREIDMTVLENLAGVANLTT